VSGALVVVATPIGNLGDLSPRARGILASADAIYCEDTRHTRILLSANQIPGGGRLFALHEHNEASMCGEVLARVERGETVALVSDAGTPGVSDPGARVIAAVGAAGLTVTTTPGASAVVAALSVSGLPMERFVMEGFFPRKGSDQRRRLTEWAHEERTIVVYESPQRLSATLNELARAFPDRRGVVVRELTKMHEEIVRGSLSELAENFARGDVRGELVVILEGALARGPADDATIQRALGDELARGSSTRDAANQVASALGASQRHVYELALGLRRDLRN